MAIETIEPRQIASLPLMSPQFGQPEIFFEPVIPEELDENDDSNSNRINVSQPEFYIPEEIQEPSNQINQYRAVVSQKNKSVEDIFTPRQSVNAPELLINF